MGLLTCVGRWRSPALACRERDSHTSRQGGGPEEENTPLDRALGIAVRIFIFTLYLYKNWQSKPHHVEYLYHVVGIILLARKSISHQTGQTRRDNPVFEACVHRTAYAVVPAGPDISSGSLKRYARTPRCTWTIPSSSPFSSAPPSLDILKSVYSRSCCRKSSEAGGPGTSGTNPGASRSWRATSPT